MPAKIRPFLWYRANLDGAMTRYAEIFGADFARLDRTELSGTPSGKTVTARFSLFGQEFMALEGGPYVEQTACFSFFVSCADQAEIDRLWSALTANGGKESNCGWLVDAFGVSWQILPAHLDRLISTPAGMAAMLEMHKLDIATLESAK